MKSHVYSRRFSLEKRRLKTMETFCVKKSADFAQMTLNVYVTDFQCVESFGKTNEANTRNESKPRVASPESNYLESKIATEISRVEFYRAL